MRVAALTNNFMVQTQFDLSSAAKLREKRLDVDKYLVHNKRSVDNVEWV